MPIEFDPAKNEQNIQDRGISLSFDAMETFDWQYALVWRDDRQDYGEERFCALGYIDNTVHSVVFTFRSDNIRIISLRRANLREQRRYYEEMKQ